MALVVRGDDAPPVKKPDPVRITKPTYKGVTVDTRYHPTSSILTTLEGSSWIVEYYQQIIDDDAGLSGQQTNREAPWQQYRLIKDFELRVTTPLSTSQNPDNKEMTLVGAAHVHPKLVPNAGDMFLADVGDGREGVFRITTSERKTIFKDTAHFIEYEFIDYSTDERRADLDRKVVLTLYYLKDFNYYGQNPLIEEEDFFLIRNLTVELRSLIKGYFSRFFSREHQSMMLPSQEYPIYDHFLTKSIRAAFNTDESNELIYLRVFNVADDQTMDALSVWDAILNQDKKFLLHAFERTGLVPTGTFTREPMMESVYHSGYQFLVYPKDNEVSVDYELQERQKEISDTNLREGKSRIKRLEDVLSESQLEGLPYGNAPLIHSILSDDYYIFSQYFYDDAVGQSKFELAVRDHIENKPVSRKLLQVFCDSYHAWGSLERFYYTPILIMLIKSVLKGA